MQKIQSFTRQMIIEDLITLGCVSGQMSMSEFVRKVFPKASDMPTTDRRFGMTTAIDDIRQHMDNNDDWEFQYLFFNYLDLLNVEDADFIYFLEQFVHPSIRRFNVDDETFERTPKSNESYVEIINKYLTGDGYELKQTSQIANMPVYGITTIIPGVQGKIKNIIFASKYKPEIVLGDALNNDIKIVNNEDKCLVYDRPITTILTWKDICNWYDDELKFLDTGVSIEEFMRKSLSSPPENLFFDTYMNISKARRTEVPALLPQVWLYYDPKLERERIKKIFEHQRMDFLMVFSETQRVVIEIDGVQHYSENTDGKSYASLDKYAEMMAAHREMSLAGYDVYRFGGKELYNETIGKRLIQDFFKRLFEKYGV